MFHVDPGWYEAYWFNDQPRPRRRHRVNAAMARLVVAVVVLGGGAALLNHLHAKDPWQGYQQWERE